MADNTITFHTCPISGSVWHCACGWDVDCPGEKEPGRTYVAVDALLSCAVLDAATLATGRPPGTLSTDRDIATSAIRAAVAALTGNEDQS